MWEKNWKKNLVTKKMKTLRATNNAVAAADARNGRRRRNPRREGRSSRSSSSSSSSSSVPPKESGSKTRSTKSKEESIGGIKVFLALRPLDGFPGKAFAYPRRALHHATVLEMTATSRNDHEDEEEEEQQRLHYLVDFAPKNPLAVETAFKLLVLRTSVEGAIRREVVDRKCTKRYAPSGMDLIGEVKRKSVLEAVARISSSSSSSSNFSGSVDSTDDDGGANNNSDDDIREAYGAVDRVLEAEFYSLYDWRNLALCKNDCRDFHRAFARYLLCTTTAGEEE